MWAPSVYFFTCEADLECFYIQSIFGGSAEILS